MDIEGIVPGSSNCATRITYNKEDGVESLRRAVSASWLLRVHVASGYYGLARLYVASEHTLSHM